MNAKAKIARMFRRNTGTRLNPLMATSTVCGAVLDLDPDGDVDFLGLLSSLDIEIPMVQTGTSTFPDFADIGNTKFNGNAKLSLNQVIPLSADLQAAVSRATEVSVVFSEVVNVEFIDIIKLSQNIAKQRDQLGHGAQLKTLNKFLRPDAGSRIVGAVYHGTIQVKAKFEGSGDVGFDATVYDCAKLGLGFKWNRTSAQSIETDQPVPFAFDAWVWRNGRLRDSD